MQEPCNNSTGSLRPPIESLDDAITILETVKKVSEQINRNLENEPMTADEFAAAIEAQITQNVIWHQVAIMRDDDSFEEKFHGE